VRDVGFGVGHSEPTTSPGFAALVRRASKLGFTRIVLSTSGMNIARRDYLRELARAGLTGVVLSMAGLDTARSDLLLARAGATEAKLAAISNSLAEGLTTFVTLMFLRPVLWELPESAPRIRRLAGWRTRGRLQLAGCLMDPAPSMENDRYAALWPRYGEAAWALRRIRQRIRHFELHSSDMPVCVRRRIAGVHRSDPQPKGTNTRFEKPAVLCAGCAWTHRCPGVYFPYWQTHGAPLLPESGELEPSPCDPSALRLALDVRAPPSPIGVAPATESWHETVRGVLQSYVPGRASIEGYHVDQGDLEGPAMITVWVAERDRMEIVIEPKARSASHFIAGDAFAVSYRMTTPPDTPSRERLLHAVLAAIEAPLA